MNRRSQAKFLATLRLISEVDTIGIPIFSGGNSLYVPEMDGDFRITRFLNFYNEEQYEIDYRLPPGYEGKSYSIGVPTPLPFWIQGKSHIIDGDAEADDVVTRFGTDLAKEAVLTDLSRLLEDARNGKFWQRKNKWTADEIAASFSDVFHEPPIHSRYWITRYNVALANARALTKPPHPIDIQLRRVAFDWLARFATKTDFPRFISLIGRAERGVISRSKTRDIVFAFLVNKVSTGNFRDIERHIDSPIFQELFPFGLIHFFEKHGWRRVPFEYRHPSDLIDLLITEIRHCNSKEQIERAERMTYLFYRRTKVPKRIDDLVIPMLNVFDKELDQLRARGDEILADRMHKQEWSDIAGSILAHYHIMMCLDGILNGDARLSRTIVNGRFGFDEREIREMRKYV